MRDQSFDLQGPRVRKCAHHRFALDAFDARKQQRRPQHDGLSVSQGAALLSECFSARAQSQFLGKRLASWL